MEPEKDEFLQADLCCSTENYGSMNIKDKHSRISQRLGSCGIRRCFQAQGVFDGQVVLYLARGMVKSSDPAGISTNMEQMGYNDYFNILANSKMIDESITKAISMIARQLLTKAKQDAETIVESQNKVANLQMENDELSRSIEAERDDHDSVKFWYTNWNEWVSIDRSIFWRLCSGSVPYLGFALEAREGEMAKEERWEDRVWEYETESMSMCENAEW
jgi:hypothetical protein